MQACGCVGLQFRWCDSREVGVGVFWGETSGWELLSDVYLSVVYASPIKRHTVHRNYWHRNTQQVKVSSSPLCINTYAHSSFYHNRLQVLTLIIPPGWSWGHPSLHRVSNFLSLSPSLKNTHLVCAYTNQWWARSIQSLYLGKVLVFIKHPSRQFWLAPLQQRVPAEASSGRQQRMGQQRIGQQRMATNDRMFFNRNYQVDATVVRIMKMRCCSLPHNLLFTECL